MAEPVVAQKSPVNVNLVEGQTYWWCSCGRSKNQPWCDGSHAGTGLTPIEYTAKRTRSMMMCACKATKKGPFCDGSHSSLP